MKYYVIDWEFKEVTDFPTKEKAEKFLTEEWEDGLKDDSVIIIKGEELQMNPPRPVEIIEKKKQEKK